MRDQQERATALLWALAAIRRHADALAGMRVEETELEPAHIEAVEAVWWVAAVDEQCANTNASRRSGRPTGTGGRLATPVGRCTGSHGCETATCTRCRSPLGRTRPPFSQVRHSQ